MANLCYLIQLILSKNSFIFNNTHGSGMGTRMGPSYANLVKGKLECEFLQTQDKIP